MYKIRYSQLDTEMLTNDLIDRYDLEAPIRCRLYDFGLNDIYVVTTKAKTYFLRISLTGMHQQIDYEEELTIIHEFDKLGLSVAAPVMQKDSSYVWEIEAPEGMRYAMMFEEAVKAPNDDKKAQVYNLGAELAKMHQAADELQVKVSRQAYDMTYLTKHTLEALKVEMAHRPEDITYLSATLTKLYDYISDLLPVTLPYYGFCHGDIHSGNVNFDGTKPVVFDFDCMGYGYRAYDICVYLWNESFDNRDYVDSDEWKSFLAGYESIRTLSEAERKTIPAFAALRQAWLIALHGDMMRRNAGCCWYNEGYFDDQMKYFKYWYDKAIVD